MKRTLEVLNVEESNKCYAIVCTEFYCSGFAYKGFLDGKNKDTKFIQFDYDNLTESLEKLKEFGNRKVNMVCVGTDEKEKYIIQLLCRYAIDEKFSKWKVEQQITISNF